MSIMSLLLFVLVYAFVSSSLNICSAADTILLNKSLSDGQTLVSSGETFELGFFSPNNSNHRYLGIWYKSISSTIVWVANRNMPLTDASGVLAIRSDGNIVVRNGSDTVFWSSNSSRSVEKPIVQLLESGNLVLKDGIFVNSDDYLWQSFDYPSDTMVPGMRQGWDLRTGLNRYLTSWKDIEDPSPGDFSYGIDLTGLPQLVLRNRSSKLYRSGVWNGFRFSGLPYFRSNPVYTATFISNTDEVYYIFEGKDNSIDTRFSVNPGGKLQRFRRDKKSLEWTVMLELPKDQCDNYNICGPNGICDINMSPVCECLFGFTPKSQQEWGMLNWTSGCVRRTALDCGGGDGFEPIKELKLPDMLHYWMNRNMSIEECKVECMKNCSCTAYTNSDISEGGSGCILWFEDLFDIRQFKESISDGKQDLYIRLAASELENVHNTQGHKKKKRVMIAILSAVSAMLLLGFTICSIIWKMRRKKGVVTDNKESQKEDVEFPLFDFMTIIAATDNFSYTNKIGEGGFGPVYKGKLAEGQEIAVKKLSKDSGQGHTEFKNEMILIAKLQHRNLVKLLGCCIEGEEKMLVYEYMPNQSLDYFIFDQMRSKLLTWPKRLSIVMGIARGLLYLHQDSRLRIIHRDLKASNILLDSNMNPKISDFGMARMFGGDETEAETKRVVGTYGYMSPEYAIDGHFSVKSDVFSFGVLVLEIVSGKRNRGFYHGEDQHNLVGHAWILWKEGKASQLIDTGSLEDSCCVSEALRCIQVGLLCLQQVPEDRPNMSSVVLLLGSEDTLLPEPKQPGFFVERSPVDTTSTEGISAATFATVSSLEAR